MQTPKIAREQTKDSVSIWVKSHNTGKPMLSDGAVDKYRKRDYAPRLCAEIK